MVWDRFSVFDVSLFFLFSLPSLALGCPACWLFVLNFVNMYCALNGAYTFMVFARSMCLHAHCLVESCRKFKVHKT